MRWSTCRLVVVNSFFFSPSPLLLLKTATSKWKNSVFLEREEKKKNRCLAWKQFLIFLSSFDEILFHECYVCARLDIASPRVQEKYIRTTRGYRRSIYNISQSQSDDLLLVAYTTLNPIFRGMSRDDFLVAETAYRNYIYLNNTKAIKKKMCTTGEGEMKKMSKSKRHSHLKAR